MTASSVASICAMVDVLGIKVPTQRRAYVRRPDLRPVRDLLMVSIDLSAFEFA